jgi:hypothetical protein
MDHSAPCAIPMERKHACAPRLSAYPGCIGSEPRLRGDTGPWADRPGRSHREGIMTERLIQDNETPPLSASLKMVVKSATTSVREFKSGCKV